MSNVIPFCRFWDRFHYNKGVISCYMCPQYCIVPVDASISVSLPHKTTHRKRYTQFQNYLIYSSNIAANIQHVSSYLAEHNFDSRDQQLQR